MPPSPGTAQLPGTVRLFPSARSGRGLPAASAVEAWATAAWLLAVEGRAYLEDLEGGADQPLLRRVVRVKLLELLYDIDTRLAGCLPVAEEHQLALALTYGLHDVAGLEGADLVEVFALAADDDETDGLVPQLWDRLCAAFPGDLPDPLQAGGQREILRALRHWSRMCAAAGTDAGFLEPFLKDA
ncbi:hypothetical protein KIH74_30570 [Kineosporia sp. J2-2]|uniref:Uncharacterized protein n=1 Tax=Kineosporia corallincola TaxID=2835133 RepID=A0ABS5TQE0_9ACTN|nr:DUF6031 family protein [Kineosporia corallincola]MBT0773329.1 hypothetical protein [Kineosporia corallincola]